MKALIIGMLIAVMLVGSASAQDARIALFTNSMVNDNEAELPIGEKFDLEIYYIQGSGPVLGHACEFRLVLSTLDAEFLTPVWSEYITMDMGDVESGISIAARFCMGVRSRVYYDIVHLGTVPVRNYADLDTFMVSLVGHPRVHPPAVQITLCSDEHPVHEVQGGTFVFNGGIRLQIIHTPIVGCTMGQDINVLWEVSDNGYGVESTCLYYRHVGEPEWSELCENNPANPIVMTIPDGDVTEGSLEYFITATGGIGHTAHDGTSDDPHMISACEDSVTCEQPMLALVGYQSLSYKPPIWQVAVEVFNSGPGSAHDVAVTMNADIPWLIIPDPVCHYGDIAEVGTSNGQTDGYRFDLSNNPGGSYNVWFDVTYEDSCANQYRLRLDPEFDPDSAEDERPSEIPSYNLFQNYPNPFNPTTTIKYYLPENCPVLLEIFDVTGKRIATLINESQEKGLYSIEWNGHDLSGNPVSAGTYFYRLKARKETISKKMILLR